MVSAILIAFSSIFSVLEAQLMKYHELVRVWEERIDKNFTLRDGIRKKPSLVGSLDTYRNQSWACTSLEPPSRRKAVTARAGV